MKFGRSQSDVPNDIRGFLGEGTDINGEVRFNEILRVDGRITGKILSDSGNLIIGDTGYIKATIEAGAVSVSGVVEGTITAKTKVEIHSRGKVLGDVFTPNLMIEPGAVFDGKCHMGDHSAPADKGLKAVEAKMPKTVESKAS